MTMHTWTFEFDYFKKPGAPGKYVACKFLTVRAFPPHYTLLIAFCLENLIARCQYKMKQIMEDRYWMTSSNAL